MKTALAPKESIRTGLLRVAHAHVRRAVALAIAARRCDAANGACDGVSAPLAQAVHEVRVTIKRLRAWWRLLRPLIPPRLHQRENARLRDAADLLSPQRDQDVALEALKRLRRRASDKTERRALDVVHRRLTRRRAATCGDPNLHAALQAAVRALQANLRALRRVKLSAQGWEAVEPGLRRSYRKARRLYRRIRQRPAEPDLHQWRKRLKDLNYQLEVFTPALSKPDATRTKRLRRLASLLGDDHDLIVIRDLLTRPAGRLPAGAPSAANAVHGNGRHAPSRQHPLEIRVTTGLLARHSGELRRRCQSMAGKLLEEKAGAFTRRIGKHWRDWRG